ncbi:MAG TPA: cell division protein ZapA [Rubrivivax sp.]|nr:cell division protein ZapA [Burkholderiales bacterium]HNU10946.1 cell division protein ZapA [Rubrivivax sp.]
MKQIEVTIMGHGYVLGCPDGGEALLTQAVARVDQEMSQIRDSGKVKARERIAVLAALNLAYQLAEDAARPQAAMPKPRGDDAGDSPALGHDGVDIEALMRRVDAALGDDGQLL